MPRQLITRLLLVGAILLAQQTALAHDFWHATSSSASGEPRNSKCDLHDLLGTVLGAVNAPLLSHELLSLAEPGFALAPAPAVRYRPLCHHSRDPPLIS